MTFARKLSGPIFTSSLVLLGAVSAQGDGVVQTDFLFQLDNSIFQSSEFELATRLQGEERFTLPDTVVAAQVPVHVKGIEAVVNYKMKSGSKYVFLGAEHMMASENVSARITIREMSVDAVVERVVSGVKVSVRVQASCENIQLDLPQGQSTIAGSIRTAVDNDGLPRVDIPWFDVSWNETSWQANDFKCQGLNGFKEEIQTGLKQYLKSPAAFSEEMKKAVQDAVVAQTRQLKEWFVQPRLLNVDVEGLKVVMHPQKILGFKATQFQIKGVLEFAFVSPSVNDVIEVKSDGSMPESQGFVLYIPDAAVSAMKSMAYRTGFLHMRKRGQEIAAFQEIRKDLINEVWVWPELQLYPKNAEFLFDFSLASEPVLSELSADKDGAPLGALDAHVFVQSWAPKGTGFEKFVAFDAPFKAQYRLTIEGGELRAKMPNPMIDLKATWDPDYAKKRRFEKVNTDLMRTELLKSLKVDGVRVPLGLLPLTSQVKLAPQQIRKEGRWLRLDWK